MEISKALLERRETPFEYILTYRFSQDQIEMFFSKIRSRFGWNNNPTVLQFKYALRQLLLKNKFDSPSTANCVDIANTNNSSEEYKVDSRISEMLLSKNVWRSGVLHYISDYIFKKMLESVECPECVVALYHNSNSSGDHGYQSHLSLLSCKRYGNLLVPSWSVYKMFEYVDKVSRTELCIWQCTYSCSLYLIAFLQASSKNNKERCDSTASPMFTHIFCQRVGTTFALHVHYAQNKSQTIDRSF